MTANVIVITKDRDFVELLFRYKSPPKVIWLTCGNTSKRSLMDILKVQLPIALSILEDTEDLVEIQ